MYASQMDPMGLISQIEIVPISQFKIYRSHGMGKSAYGFQPWPGWMSHSQIPRLEVVRWLSQLVFN